MRELSIQGLWRSCALIALWTLPLSAGGANGLQVLIASGDSTPFAGIGVPPISLGEGSFNAQGQLAAVVLVPTGGPRPWESLVIATGSDGVFRVVARESVPLLGAPSGQRVISSAVAPVINSQGKVAFGVSIYPNGYPPASTDSYYDTIWSEAGGLHAVDTQLSDPYHHRYDTLLGLGNNGNVLYRRNGWRENGSSPLSDDPELLIEENGVSRSLFRRYDGAPVGDCPAGQFCSIQQDFAFGSALNSDGTAIYGMQIKGVGITTLNNDFILRRTSAGTSTLVRDGDPAWGLPSGYRFSHVIAPDSASNGEIVFESYLDTPNGGELEYSLFSSTGGVQRMIARHGAPAPGFGTRTITEFSNFYATETGHPVIEAYISGTAYKRAVFREAAGQLSLISQSDEPAPGIVGALLSGNAHLNDSPITGATLVTSDWYNPDLSTYGVGLWRIDQGNWQLLLSSGQSIEVSPGVFRTINSLNPQKFTATGMLPISASFADGTNALLSWSDTPPRLVGDANADGKVDANDYLMLRKNFGKPVLGGDADFNGDRIINSADYQLWRLNYGHLVGGQMVNAIPEPAAATLSVLALAALALSRFRSRAFHASKSR